MKVARDKATHQHLIHMIRAHPLVASRWHDGQRWVETVEMPVQVAVVAGNDAAPAAYI